MAVQTIIQRYAVSMHACCMCSVLLTCFNTLVSRPTEGQTMLENRKMLEPKISHKRGPCQKWWTVTQVAQKRVLHRVKCVFRRKGKKSRRLQFTRRVRRQTARICWLATFDAATASALRQQLDSLFFPFSRSLPIHPIYLNFQDILSQHQHSSRVYHPILVHTHHSHPLLKSSAHLLPSRLQSQSYHSIVQALPGAHLTSSPQHHTCCTCAAPKNRAGHYGVLSFRLSIMLSISFHARGSSPGILSSGFDVNASCTTAAQSSHAQRTLPHIQDLLCAPT